MPIADFTCHQCNETFELDVRATRCAVCGGSVERLWSGKAPAFNRVAPFVDKVMDLPSTPKPRPRTYKSEPEMVINEMPIAKPGQPPLTAQISGEVVRRMLSPDAIAHSQALNVPLIRGLQKPMPVEFEGKK